LELIPYGRIGQPADIGKAAVWLASDDSDYVNGQTIFVCRRHDALSGVRRTAVDDANRRGIVARVNSRKIPAGVWVLGFVSLCMDISSEMIHALLPVFMITYRSVRARSRSGCWRASRRPPRYSSKFSPAF
jgi:hypothetical protein